MFVDLDGASTAGGRENGQISRLTRLAMLADVRGRKEGKMEYVGAAS